jgi:hypothetical protein
LSIDIKGTATGSEVVPISVLKALIAKSMKNTRSTSLLEAVIIKSRKNHQSTRTIIACTIVVPTGMLKAVLLRLRGRIKLILFFCIVGP